MVTKHRDVVHVQTVSCLGKIVTYRAHAQIEAVAEATPLIASNCSGSFNGDVLTLFERCYWTTDRYRYDKEQISPLALLEARWLARAPA